MDIFEKFPVLETERLYLRRITTDDTEKWGAVFEHPDVTRFLVDFDQTVPLSEAVKELIQWADAIYLKRTGIRWAITHKPDDNMIGSCGFHLYSPANRCAEVGYELHRNHWRQGIMREALDAVVRFGLERLNLHRIEANVTAGNVASAKLLGSLGFIMEGTWRDKVLSQGCFYDLWQFSLLEDDSR